MTVKDRVKEQTSSVSVNQDSADDNVQINTGDDNNSELITACSNTDVGQNDGDNFGEPEEKKQQLNIVYTLFWTYLATCVCSASFLWVDLIPGFGLVTKPSLLGKQ